MLNSPWPWAVLCLELVFIAASLWLWTHWVKAEKHYFRFLSLTWIRDVAMLWTVYWVATYYAPDFLSFLHRNPMVRRTMTVFISRLAKSSEAWPLDVFLGRMHWLSLIVLA